MTSAASQPSTAPVLSTPDTHIFEDPTPTPDVSHQTRLSVDEICDVYEIRRTAREIRAGGWRTIALQFPDHMLYDAPQVFEALRGALEEVPANSHVAGSAALAAEDAMSTDVKPTQVDEARGRLTETTTTSIISYRLCILADTSYGACCVDEVAAEHIDAEVVVHYGRSCLSPTARLPVIYVFTTQPLDIDSVVKAFNNTYTQKGTKVVLMADLVCSRHVAAVLARLTEMGYTNVFCPDVVHDPSSLLPNRTVPAEVSSGAASLGDYSLFHISDPPQSLLLTLSSRLASMYICSSEAPNASTSATEAQTMRPLRRRYGLVTSLSTCGVFGLLINTLSVKNYMTAISKIQEQIARAGKKSYTFVVGKVNAAKVANFADIGAWVVVGCWESSLIDSSDFFRPIITPFELELCLMPDSERIWTGEWRGDFTSTLREPPHQETGAESQGQTDAFDEAQQGSTALEDGEESLPPEFDLRTGRYVSHSRPMASAATARQLDSLGSTPAAPSSSETSAAPSTSQTALARRANGTLATIGGVFSPGAEFLRTQRTWTGLGSDFDVEQESGDVARGEDSAGKEKYGLEGALIEEGRSGIARGYSVGSSAPNDKR